MHLHIAICSLLAVSIAQPLSAKQPHTGTARCEQALAAAPAAAGQLERALPAQNEVLDFVPLSAFLAPPDDLSPGAGAHSAELRSLAIYRSIGNEVGEQILKQRLRKFGMSRDAVQSAIDGMKLHAASPGAHSLDRSQPSRQSGDSRPLQDSARFRLPATADALLGQQSAAY